MVWRGGFNCRHVWSRIEYKKDATIVNKASVNKGKVTIGGFPTDMVPDTRVLGYDQPSTVTSKTAANPSPSTVRNLGLSKDKFAESCPIATQDVETNLKNRQRAIDEAHYGPLNPNEPNEDYWEAKAKMFGGDVESAKKALCGNCAFFVKTPSMLQCIADGINDINELDTIQVANIGYCEAFDFKCAGARTCDAWVVGGPIVDEDMGYDVGTIGGYVDPGVTGNTIPKSITKPSMFESYSDYPDSVKNNAKAVLKYAEENGWGSCGTEVGKQRANQLAKGEPISEDTIRRMYSYLSRHAVDLDSSKGYGDGCGKLMYDAWGGKSALSWSEAKIKTIEKEKMSKQRFATDDEKRIVIGPAMIPDLKIFRKDSKGNPYYVYFSSDTIKMIAEKYMRNKYIDNNDENHNGKAVSDVYVVESWIKEDVQDKSSKYGYSDLPVGTWFVSMKVRNDEVWKKVKEGYLNGFSVSGYFEEVASFCMEEMFLKQVVKILNNVND
jgi:effector-binding domain-containing protein